MYNYEIYKTLKLLDEGNLSKVLKLIEKSKEYDWQDGNKTFSGADGTKKNKELRNEFFRKSIVDIVLESAKKSSELCEFTFPKTLDYAIISKTEEGDYYNTHVDSADTGDFSVTLFLFDKESYEGGELCLWINGKEEKIKLNPGYCVVYPTGTPHRVNMVRSGVRCVVVFWIKSIFKDKNILECCRELRSIDFGHDIKEYLPIPVDERMEEVISSSEFKLQNAIHRLMRTYGDF